MIDKNTTYSPSPKLQPPGTPLPFVQRIVLRFFIGPVLSKRTSASQTRLVYENATARILDRVRDLPDELRRQRVLVDPMWGLEDSSRFWCINEVLEHCLIVSKEMEFVILQLSAGRVPEKKASTAAVKPQGNGRDFFEEFQNFSVRLMQRLDDELKRPDMSINSGLTYFHPWFHKMTAKQWYRLLGVHQALHERQINQILNLSDLSA